MCTFRSTVIATVLGAGVSIACGGDLPVMPGFEVEVFADVTDPVMISFADDGMLYVGRDNSGSGGGPGDPVPIHRITPDGVATEFGSAIPDPDAVLFDGAGTIGSGNSVLVAGIVTAGRGRFSEVLVSDQSVGIICESTVFENPSDMVFDRDGRLLFTGNTRSRIFVSEGECPAVALAVSPGPISIAVDDENRIFVGGTDGVVRSFEPDGTPISPSVIQVSDWPAITFGTGGAFGTDLYVLERTTGILHRVGAGGACPVGTGFLVGVVGDLAFGPDGALYVSDMANDRILRVTPSCRADVDGDGAVSFNDILALLSAWGPCPCCPEDIDGDGEVAFADLLEVLTMWGPCP